MITNCCFISAFVWFNLAIMASTEEQYGASFLYLIPTIIFFLLGGFLWLLS
jgi:hypothetical protein